MKTTYEQFEIDSFVEDSEVVIEAVETDSSIAYPHQIECGTQNSFDSQDSDNE